MYSVNESLERIYRSMLGQQIDDQANLVGSNSYNESLDGIARILEAQGSFSQYINTIIRLSGAGVAWDDLRVPTTSTKLGGSKDPEFAVALTNGSGSQGVFTHWFDAAQEEELYFSVQLPHNWLEGSDIYPHVHWIPKSNGSSGQVVAWGLEYSWSNIGGTFGNTSITSANAHFPADTTLVANRHYITSLPVIDGSDKTLSSMILCRVFRDAAASLKTDSYTADAGLLEIDFHYEIDSFGSSQELIK